MLLIRLIIKNNRRFIRGKVPTLKAPYWVGPLLEEADNGFLPRIARIMIALRFYCFHTGSFRLVSIVFVDAQRKSPAS